jgi:hypothetical protein
VDVKENRGRSLCQGLRYGAGEGVHEGDDQAKHRQVAARATVYEGGNK